jgi:hypothetical protein
MDDRLRHQRLDEVTLQPARPCPTYLGAERRDADRRSGLVRRVSHEYEEMPGLSLTPVQARRLFGLRADVCERLLGELVRHELLRCTVNGRYVLNRPAA